MKAQDNFFAFDGKNYKKINYKRLNTVKITALTAEAGVFVGLNYLWYKEYQKSAFHFFDDAEEWLQMDKCGHFYTTYWTSYFGKRVLKWTQMDDRKAMWYSTAYSLSFVTLIEIFDGFSEQWGFSVSDMGANVGGALLFVGQELGWKEQRIKLKYSYNNSQYSGYRPKLLGKNIIEKPLKDYNGQIYWLCVNPSKFAKHADWMPKWLMLSFGYGADAMITGKPESKETLDNLDLPYFERFRQFYLSFDLDLTAFRNKRYPWLNSVLELFNTVKIPFPGIEFNERDRFVFHPFCF